MTRSTIGFTTAMVLAFSAGFLAHVLYQRWNPPEFAQISSSMSQDRLATGGDEPAVHRVIFAPLAAVGEENTVDMPLLEAREVEKIRTLANRQARIRGRVFRVGHAVKSNTYFLSFGPSREALTAVIFNSAAELFEKEKQSPKNFENREVELSGFIKDHPQYGLEVVIEHPKQIKIVN